MTKARRHQHNRVRMPRNWAPRCHMHTVCGLQTAAPCHIPKCGQHASFCMSELLAPIAFMRLPLSPCQQCTHTSSCCLSSALRGILQAKIASTTVFGGMGAPAAATAAAWAAAAAAVPAPPPLPVPRLPSPQSSVSLLSSSSGVMPRLHVTQVWLCPHYLNLDLRCWGSVVRPTPKARTQLLMQRKLLGRCCCPKHSCPS